MVLFSYLIFLEKKRKINIAYVYNIYVLKRCDNITKGSYWEITVN